MGDNLASFDVNRSHGDVIGAVCIEKVLAGGDGFFGDLLGGVVEGGRDGVAAGAHGGDAVFFLKLRLHFENEVGSFDVVVLTGFGDDGVENVDGLCFIGFFLSDIAHFNHDVQSLLLALDEHFVAVFVVGIQDARVVRDGGEEGRFGEREILGGFVEVGLCGGFNTIAATAVWGLVEIHRDDGLFVVHFLELESEDELLDFTSDTTAVFRGGFFREVDLFDELLREGGATLDALTGEGGDGGTEEGFQVNAWVLVEVAVFDGDGGLAHVGGDFGAVNNETIIVGAFVFPEDNAVAVEIGVDRFGDFHLVEVDVVEFLFVIGKKAGDADNTDDAKDADGAPDFLLPLDGEPVAKEVARCEFCEKSLHRLFRELGESFGVFAF